MIIYEAYVGNEEIVLHGYEVEKETPKQYQIKGFGRLNKYMIGNVNSSRHAYGLSKDEAVETLKEDIKNRINVHENEITFLKEILNYKVRG